MPDRPPEDLASDRPGDPEVLSELRGSAMWIRLNRPHRMNAFNAAVWRLLAEAVARAEQDPAIRSIVIIGEGGRAFSSGGDLKAQDELASGEPGESERLSKVGFGALRHCAKPTIAAIDGHCMGAGFETASLCDIRLATEQSRFVLPEVRHSLMPDPGLIELPRLMPRGELMLMLLAGRPLPARRAYEIGLVQELLPDRPALIAAAEAITTEIALGAPLAVKHYKHVVRETDAPVASRAEHLRDPLWDTIRNSQDRQEAASAYAGKRPPDWRGC